MFEVWREEEKNKKVQVEKIFFPDELDFFREEQYYRYKFL
jgi:hypothetical protein